MQWSFSINIRNSHQLINIQSQLKDFFLKSLYITHTFSKKCAKFSSFYNQNKLKIKCLNRWNWYLGVLVFKIFPEENTPGLPYIGRTFSARMFCPSTSDSFLSLCIANFIVRETYPRTSSFSSLPPSLFRMDCHPWQMAWELHSVMKKLDRTAYKIA